jgi:hypothetical protein
MISLKFTLSELNFNEVKTDYGVAYVVNTPKAPNILELGSPDLIYLTGSIIIPERGSMDIEVIPGEFEEFFNIEIAPSKGVLTRDLNPEDVPYLKGKVYQENAFYPGELASLRDPYILRDFRGQSIDVFPVQYNPVSKTLRVYSNLTVIVKPSGKPGVNEMQSNRQISRVDREFSDIYKRMFLNYNKSRYPILEEEGDLLIICFDSFMDAMQPFVNWKRTIGRKTTIVPKSEAGSTSAAIKSFVVDFYNDPENNLTHLLLVGDAPQIPAGVISGSGDSDNFYGYITGNDSYNELFVGRFSAETVAHVETQVQRMIEYERDITTDDAWLNIGMGIARNEGTGSGHNGENDYVHMDFIRDTLLNFTYETVYREYDGNVPGVTNTTAAQISNGINNGVSIINFCNHGSETGWSVANYSITHVNALTNVGKLPFIWSVACVNGNFVTNFCFAEAWLRATHNGEPTGAIGTMMSTINQPWQPPMTGQDEMVGILAEGFPNNIKRTFGGTSINGSMKMLDVHGTSGKQTHDTWVLFGDPTLMVRTDIPMDMIVSHNPTLFLGSTTFTVSCDTDDAIVAVSYEDDEGEVHLLASAIVQDGSALVEFEEPITEPVDLVIAITAFNKVTYLGTVSAVPADEPYVILKSFETTVSPDFGQVVGINVILENISEDPYTASAVEATITSVNEYVNIIDNSVLAGTIIPGEIATLNGAFSIEIADNVPNQNPMIFIITITGEYDGDDYQWAQNFVIKANAPVLGIGNLTIDDGGEGVPNYLEPGESAQVVLTLTNTGKAAAQGVSAWITAASPFFNILEGEATVDVEAEGEVQVSFPVEANASTPDGHEVLIVYGAGLGVYTAEGSEAITVGPKPESTIGEGNEDTQSYYPLDNYYKANKSQMLYLASEVSLAPQTIKELGFYIKSIGTVNPYVNLTIKLMETDLTVMPSAYVSTTGATTVFSATSYTMPSAVGWLVFDIDDFEYSGEHNLLVEVTFGINAEWTSTRYRVSCTSTTGNSVAYGYSDTQAIPNYSGVTNKRPNLYLAFDADYADFYPVMVSVEDIYQVAVPDAVVVIGSLGLVTDEAGQQSLELPTGSYPWTASKEGYIPQSGLLEVADGEAELQIVLPFLIGDEAEILTFGFEEDVVEYVTISAVEENAATILVGVSAGTDVSSLTPTITVSYGATVSPMGGEAMDFTEPVTFVVTSEDELTVNTYTVIVSEVYTVTFTVNMTNAEGFDPSEDVVYLTGSMVDWAEPGTMAEVQAMTREEGTMTWSITHQLAAGDYQYKYFLNDGWDGGEWDGDPNRTVTVSEDMVVEDNWGIKPNVGTSVLVNLAVYPNPFSGQITVSNAEMVTRVVISNILGEVVMDRTVNASAVSISTEGLSRGVYLVTFMAGNGERVTKKMIKQ